MFDIVLFGALCLVIGSSATIWVIQVTTIETIEDIWKLLGNFLGHTFAFEIAVAIMVFIAEFVFTILGIV